jgi:hypothetical protein
MAEIERITFTHQEVVTALLKARSIHEGLWTLCIEFSLGATYVGSSEDCVLPAAIIPVVEIGIGQTDQLNNRKHAVVLSVDASKVNPIKD